MGGYARLPGAHILLAPQAAGDVNRQLRREGLPALPGAPDPKLQRSKKAPPKKVSRGRKHG